MLTSVPEARLGALLALDEFTLVVLVGVDHVTLLVVLYARVNAWQTHTPSEQALTLSQMNGQICLTL